MKIQRTITIIPEDDSDLRKTVSAVMEVKQTLSPLCFNRGKPLNSFKLQDLVYRQVRGKINSQMTCTAIRCVAGAYSSAKKNGHPAKRPFSFKRKSALFLIGVRGRDADFHRSGKLSIWTVNGRKRLSYLVPEFFKATFSAAVSYDCLDIIERDGKLHGRLCLTLEVPDPVSTSPVGIDLNETNAVVAVDKDGEVFFESGLKTKTLNRRNRKTKRRLQKKMSSRKAENKNTHSVVRVLKRLGKKEQRRTLDFARVTAKRLCTWAKPKAVLVFEELSFKQQKRYDGNSKATHRKLSAFPHGIIRQCVTNRAQLVGIGVDKVNPYNTSRIHNKCGLIGVRKRHDFYCPHCDVHEHADINAAVNIRNRFTSLRASGVQSTTPEASKVEAILRPTNRKQVDAGQLSNPHPATPPRVNP